MYRLFMQASHFPVIETTEARRGAGNWRDVGRLPLSGTVARNPKPMGAELRLVLVAAALDGAKCPVNETACQAQ